MKRVIAAIAAAAAVMFADASFAQDAGAPASPPLTPSRRSRCKANWMRIGAKPMRVWRGVTSRATKRSDWCNGANGSSRSKPRGSRRCRLRLRSGSRPCHARIRCRLRRSIYRLRPSIPPRITIRRPTTRRGGACRCAPVARTVTALEAFAFSDFGLRAERPRPLE